MTRSAVLAASKNGLMRPPPEMAGMGEPRNRASSDFGTVRHRVDARAHLRSIPPIRNAWRRYWLYRSSAERAISAGRRYWKASPAEKGRLKRAWFFNVSRTFAPIMGVDAPEGMLLVQTGDIDLGKGTFIDGAWDRTMVEYTIEKAQELSGQALAGATVLEIGANIGTTTLLLLRKFGVDRVVAFEPAPSTVRVLRAMLALNGLEGRVDVRPVALTDSEITLRMELSPRSPGDNRVRVAQPEDSQQGEDQRELIDVRGVPLDAELPDLDGVALVWMDAQGHEGQILAGASNLLEAGVPVITEFWPYALRRAEGLEMFLSLVERHYARVFDTGHGDPSVARIIPASEVRSLVELYPAHDDFTDLILLAN